MPRCVCDVIRSWFGFHLFVGYAEWARRDRTKSSLIRSVRFLLLDSSIDLTWDGDDGVLLDPIFFGPFNRSYEKLFNKTSRMRYLDGFDSINSRNYIWKPFPSLYIYTMCELTFRDFMACISVIVCVTAPREFPVGRLCRLVTEVAPASVLHVE